MKTDREKHSLRGPVKTLQVETARLDEQDGRLVEVPGLAYYVRFNPDGQIVEQVNRNPDGTEWRTTNDYSDSGRLLATRHYAPSGLLSGEVRYVYDEGGKLVAEQTLTGDGNVTTPVTYVYDGEGRKVKTEELDCAGEADLLIGIEGTGSSVSAAGASRIETRYDERGEAIEVEVFDEGGVLTSRTEIVRDGRGNPLEERQYVGATVPFGPCSADASPGEETAELTEEQGAELQAEFARLFPPGTPLSKHVHRYDGEGRLVESTLTMMGMEAGRRTFAYDEFGDKSEEVSYGEGGAFESKAIFTREHDGRGNWTKEVVSTASSWDAEFGLSTPVHVTRRVVTYY